MSEAVFQLVRVSGRRCFQGAAAVTVETAGGKPAVRNASAHSRPEARAGGFGREFRLLQTGSLLMLAALSVPSTVQVVTSQRSDRTHAAAKQLVPMAMPMAGTRNQ
jgi:hypothetical protein